MKRLFWLVVVSTLLLGCCGCHHRAAPHQVPTDIEAIAQSSDLCIDSAAFDIDSDGIAEDCVMTYGPTSGLFTVVITVYERGTVEYKNTFNLSWSELSFDITSTPPKISMTKTNVENGESFTEHHNVYIQNRRIVIDGLDPDFEGYWGDKDWNLY